MSEKDEPREYIVKEMMWAYRHLFASRTILMDSMRRCRKESGGVLPEHANAMEELSKVSAFCATGMDVLQRSLEYLKNMDVDDVDQATRTEGVGDALLQGFIAENSAL